MSDSTVSLMVLAAATLAIIAVLVRRPESAATLGGKVLAFLAFFVLPGLLLLGGAGRHYRQAQTTEFCLSCHVIQPYAESLSIDDARFLPASHYQNKRIPADRACYACHTDYTMFGDVDDKLRGVKHVWRNFWGSAADPVQLYDPYPNRTCFECHRGARSYEEHDAHSDFKEELLTGGKSCLICHNLVHEADRLDRFGRWNPEEHSR